MIWIYLKPFIILGIAGFIGRLIYVLDIFSTTARKTWIFILATGVGALFEVTIIDSITAYPGNWWLRLWFIFLSIIGALWGIVLWDRLRKIKWKEKISIGQKKSWEIRRQRKDMESICIGEMK